MYGRSLAARLSLGLLAFYLVACADDAGSSDGADPSDQAVLPFACESDDDCTDGLYCNGDERCSDDGLCVRGETPDCDDGIACTSDVCDERITGCRHDAPDADRDGHPDAACEDADGNALGDDCDDADPMRFPGNTEVCDALDHDEDCNYASFGEQDADGDGHLNANCCNEDPSTGTRTCGDDCDDGNRAAYPGNTEVCDAIDNDCNGLFDNPIEDVDGDGYATVGCGGNDCDDHNPNVHAGATEICDGLDSDCSLGGGVEALEQDLDTDGFVVGQCEATAALAPGDCDDVQRGVHPTAIEVCDGRDNDCDALIDEDAGDCGHGIRILAARFRNSMAVHLDGTVSAWGDNPLGFTHTGATESTRYPTRIRDLREPSGLLSHVGSIGLGNEFACAVHRDGRVSCFGYGLNGRLANGESIDSVLPPADIGLGNIVKVAVGGSHACALDSTGALYCWGANFEGRVGDGTTTTRSRPVKLGLADVRDVALGLAFTCAVQGTGRVYCWGSNDHGQLGDTSFNDRSSPTRVFGVDDAVQVACGTHTACVVHADRTLSCWGSNDAGQQGGSELEDATRPEKVLDASGRPLQNVVDVAVSGDQPSTFTPPEIGTTCARLADGLVMCLGANDYGQLGIGAESSYFFPDVPVIYNSTFAEYPALTDYPENWAQLETIAPFRATQIVGGQGHLCATNEQGLAHCWGRGGNYELGSTADGAQIPRLVENLP